MSASTEYTDRISTLERKVRKLETNEQFINSINGILNNNLFKSDFISQVYTTSEEEFSFELPEIVLAEGEEQDIYVICSATIFIDGAFFPAFFQPSLYCETTGNPDILLNGDFRWWEFFFLNPYGATGTFPVLFLSPKRLVEGTHRIHFDISNQSFNQMQVDISLGYIYLPKN